MAEKNETTLVNFKVDSIVKESAEGVLSGMGLNLSSYIGMCLRQVAQEAGLPFTPKFDPEFWIDEAAVSKAAKIINSNIFGKYLKIKQDEEVKGCWEFNAKSHKFDESLQQEFERAAERLANCWNQCTMPGNSLLQLETELALITDEVIAAAPELRDISVGVATSIGERLMADKEVNDLIGEADDLHDFLDKVDDAMSLALLVYYRNGKQLCSRFASTSSSEEWTNMLVFKGLKENIILKNEGSNDGIQD
ncbi:MAG: type II toxin-antitoxin system RelB/DinJ family antitoxin [Coriobacteriia bacterium]|nr:type II toxin-antitoxin system RelB/DinJ family antitoxin [Coriobacteriia bacterium]